MARLFKWASIILKDFKYMWYTVKSSQAIKKKKNQIQHHIESTSVAKIEKTDHTKCWKGYARVGRLNTLLAGMSDSTTTLEKSWAIS